MSGRLGSVPRSPFASVKYVFARWAFSATLLGLGCSRAVPQRAPSGEASAVHAPVAVVPVSTADGDGGFTPPKRLVPEPPKNGVYLGRKLATPMSHLGAPWLDRATRDAEQKPEHVLDVLGVRKGQRVCDFGAGSGYFTVHMARRVGDEGRVFAVDVQPEMLVLLGKKLAAEKLANVTSVLAKPSEPSLPPQSVDLVLMVDVYHELERPDLTMAQLREALAPGGRVAWVEYRAEDPNVAIKAEHKTTLVQLRKEAEAAGYRVERVDESLPQQRIVVLVPS
jgi:ubiquinone/menaquinone biosynthesis C-methylase UbiE